MTTTQQPLAYAMRPQTLEEVIGQQHLIGKGKILYNALSQKKLFSMIFYGPPGTGKTTLASVLANELKLPFRKFNATTGNKKELDSIFKEAHMYPGLVVIVDEVHRLNKDKQDLLLPHIESGNILMIGATTANPLFAINPAIRSRVQLFEIKPLTTQDIMTACKRAMVSPSGLNNEVEIEEETLQYIAKSANGDIRYALNMMELCRLLPNPVTLSSIQEYNSLPNILSDQDGDYHYDLLSAFQKSIRGSDVDAALYYLYLLIEIGDLLSLERRLLVCAYEDIGLANPAAVARCATAIDVAKKVGFPEGRIPLAHTIIDLCLSPKSKSAEQAIDSVRSKVKDHAYQVPDYLRLTPVNKNKADVYDYDRSDLWSSIQYLPDALANTKFYEPSLTSQYEKALASNLETLNKTKRSNQLATLKKK